MKKGLLLLALFLCGVALTAAAASIEPILVSPEAGATVRTLDIITLTFAEDIDLNPNAKVTVEAKGNGLTTGSAKLVYHESDYDKLYVKLSQAIDAAGQYRVVIPAGAIWDYATQSKKSEELAFDYNIDPEYWDPEWIYEAGEETKSSETPLELIAGRKYKFNQTHNYTRYTAEKTGRLVFAPMDGSKLKLTYHDENWTRLKDLEKDEEGNHWLGVEAGSSYNIKDYIMFGEHTFKVNFEEIMPYETIEFIESVPADGGIYNALMDGHYSHMSGTVDFVFTHRINCEILKVTVVLPSKGNKQIEITGEVTINQGSAWKNNEQIGYYYAVEMADIMGGIIADNGLNSGDKIQLVLENIQDVEYTENRLSGAVTADMTLATTICTSVNPSHEKKVSEVPAELRLRFNNPTTGTGGRIADTKSGKEAVLDASCFKTSSFEDESGILVHETTVSLPNQTFIPTSRQFTIELYGMTDDQGNSVSYGEEPGKFVLNYLMRDDTFTFISAQPKEDEKLTSIKETRLTFADQVNIAPNAPKAMLSNYDDVNIEGELAVAPNDPKTVIITWDKEITEPGEYHISLSGYSIYDSRFNAEKDDYGLADGASANPDIYLSYTIAADLSATTVVSISPESFDTNRSTIEQLPEEVVITLSGEPQKIVVAYGCSLGGMTPFSTEAEEAPEGTDILPASIIGNKIAVSIPESVIAANTTEEYTIVLSVVGEDGKLIGGNLTDEFDNHIQFSYFLMDELTLTASTPADGSQVEEIKEIVLTFEKNMDETYDPFGSTDEEEGWEKPIMLTRIDSYNIVAERLVPAIKGNQATISLTEAVVEEGVYELSIPGGVFYEAGFENMGEPLRNGAKKLTFTIGDATIEPLAIVEANPQDGTATDVLTQIELALNKQVGYLSAGLLIGNNGKDAHSASLIQSATDPKKYTLDFTHDGLLKNIELKEGITYTITLEAYSSEEACNLKSEEPETATLTYVGTHKEYAYSLVKFEGATPNEDFVITDKTQNKFVIRFSDAVTLVDELTYINIGQGATKKFESITGNAGKTEYTLTIAENLLASIRGTVNLVFAANDAGGLRLKGNNGEGDSCTFTLCYQSLIGVPDLTVIPEADKDLASLSTISVLCDKGLTRSWTAGEVTLTNENGEEIALNEPEAVATGEWETPVKWNISLQEELKTTGSYTLTIPAGYFNIGREQGQIIGNKETIVTFRITKEAQNIRNIQAYGDTEVTVYNVTGVVVCKGKASDVLKKLTKGIYIVEGRKMVVR